VGLSTILITPPPKPKVIKVASCAEIVLNNKAKEICGLDKFYRLCGYGGSFEQDDEVYYLMRKKRVIAAARICNENGTYLLRGMQVLPALRGQQIGRYLLAFMVNNLPTDCVHCFCLPHQHLIAFYADAGFSVNQHSNVPAFILERVTHYKKQGLQLVLMERITP